MAYKLLHADSRSSQHVEWLVHTTGDLSGDATGDLDLLLIGDLDLDLSRAGDTDRAGETDWSLTGDLASPSTFTGSSSLPEPAGLGDPSSDILSCCKSDTLRRISRIFITELEVPLTGYSKVRGEARPITQNFRHGAASLF